MTLSLSVFVRSSFHPSFFLLLLSLELLLVPKSFNGVSRPFSHGSNVLEFVILSNKASLLSNFSLKGNMHHIYDISLKYAFYIIDLAAGIFFEKFDS